MLETRHEAGSLITVERNQTPMNKIVHYIGLEVHKETIAVSIAPQVTALLAERSISA
jgi:hypothetical protein